MRAKWQKEAEALLEAAKVEARKMVEEGREPPFDKYFTIEAILRASRNRDSTPKEQA